MKRKSYSIARLACLIRHFDSSRTVEVSNKTGKASNSRETRIVKAVVDKVMVKQGGNDDGSN